MSSLTSTASRTGLLRIGLGLATALAALDIVGAVAGMPGSDAFGLTVAIVMLALAGVTLVLLVPAWRGSRSAAVWIAALRVVASLAGLPAFFVAGVPAFVVVIAAAGIVLAVVAAALILSGVGRR